VSLWERLSDWSLPKAQGAAITRFTLHITMGALLPEAKWSISCMRASPWEAVAVKVRTPVRDAAMQAAIAECSDSVRIIMPVSFPSFSMSDSFS
jgi:hypothetical protein